MMESVGQSVADAMALMVHEIKGDLFELSDLVSENKEAVLRIDEIARRAERTVAYYQIASGSNFFCVSPVCVDDLIREAIGRVGEKEGIAISVAPDGGHVWLVARDLIGDILANGLRNAIRYAKSQILVSATVSDAGDLCVCISDDGAGFPDIVLQSGPLALGGGLFIADRVMALHKANGSRGFLSMENRKILSGASLSLVFPGAMNGDC